jgi:hypothetical protein
MFSFATTGAAVKALAITIGVGVALQAATVGAWWWHASSLRGEVTQAATDLGTCSAGRDSAVIANGQWEADALAARVDLNACQAQWADAKADAEFHAAAAAEHRLNAVKWAEAFAGRYAGKSPACAAALAPLDAACPELEGY